MRTAHYGIRRVTSLAGVFGLVIASVIIGARGLAQAAEDPFDSLAVQRLAQRAPAPDLALPSLEGKTIHLKDFRDEVVLLGFFTTT
jgi:cytochrome oxidase Cu insertion factor (SCO1/SenC/PrrC family)